MLESYASADQLHLAKASHDKPDPRAVHKAHPAQVDDQYTRTVFFDIAVYNGADIPRLMMVDFAREQCGEFAAVKNSFYVRTAFLRSYLMMLF